MHYRQKIRSQLTLISASLLRYVYVDLFYITFMFCFYLFLIILICYPLFPVPFRMSKPQISLNDRCTKFILIYSNWFYSSPVLLNVLSGPKTLNRHLVILQNTVWNDKCRTLPEDALRFLCLIRLEGLIDYLSDSKCHADGCGDLSHPGTFTFSFFFCPLQRVSITVLKGPCSLPAHFNPWTTTWWNCLMVYTRKKDPLRDSDGWITGDLCDDED